MKPVELQIAVPRTHDAGRLQNEQQHRPMNDQHLLAGQNVKEADELRRRSTEVNESVNNSIREDDRQQSSQQGSSHRSRKQGQEAESDKTVNAAEHPYKGKHIDFSL
ncbi:hypothetical protein PASE110613_06325 [Paenibacillus sediminis]